MSLEKVLNEQITVRIDSAISKLLDVTVEKGYSKSRAESCRFFLDNHVKILASAVSGMESVLMEFLDNVNLNLMIWHLSRFAFASDEKSTLEFVSKFVSRIGKFIADSKDPKIIENSKFLVDNIYNFKEAFMKILSSPGSFDAEGPSTSSENIPRTETYYITIPGPNVSPDEEQEHSRLAKPILECITAILNSPVHEAELISRNQPTAGQLLGMQLYIAAWNNVSFASISPTTNDLISAIDWLNDTIPGVEEFRKRFDIFITSLPVNMSKDQALLLRKQLEECFNQPESNEAGQELRDKAREEDSGKGAVPVGKK